jgi:hypothetical protein
LIVKGGKMYKLEINEKQASIIVDALDLYSRLFTGQFVEILYKLDKLDIDMDRYDFERMIKKLVFPELENNEHYGITGAKEEARIAYDILQVVRHGIFKSHNNCIECWGVSSYPPLQFSKEELPVMKETNKENKND